MRTGEHNFLNRTTELDYLPCVIPVSSMGELQMETFLSNPFPIVADIECQVS